MQLTRAQLSKLIQDAMKQALTKQQEEWEKAQFANKMDNQEWFNNKLGKGGHTASLPRDM
jgi:uncharacterized protein YhjY with autotransporter beta-barrel domain